MKDHSQSFPLTRVNYKTTSALNHDVFTRSVQWWSVLDLLCNALQEVLHPLLVFVAFSTPFLRQPVPGVQYGRVQREFSDLLPRQVSVQNGKAWAGCVMMIAMTWLPSKRTFVVDRNTDDIHRKKLTQAKKKKAFTAFTRRKNIMLALAVVLPIIGSYIITSVVLLNFPTILHKRKNTKFRCRHISHRGGWCSLAFIENFVKCQLLLSLIPKLSKD